MQSGLGRHTDLPPQADAMKINLRWQVLLALAGLSLALALLAIRPASPSAELEEGQRFCTTRVPVAGGVMVEGMAGAPRYLNPLLSDPNPVDRELVDLLYDGLTRYDSQGQVQPALAETWTVASDGRTLRFSLRQDVRWHDGRPLTAQDVLATYRLLQDESLPAPTSLKRLWQSVTIQVIDDHTLDFILAEPYAPFLDAVTRGIMPAHLLGDIQGADLPGHSINITPVGTGPFRLVRGNDWTRQGFVRLEPNPDQPWPPSQIEALEFHFFPDSQTLLEAYGRGEIQAISRVEMVDVPLVADLPDVRLFSAPERRLTQLFFNLSETGAPAVRDIRIRQALAWGLDRSAILHTALNGQGVPLYGPYLPDASVYDPSVGFLPTQIVSATALLDEAGWVLPAGQTLRQQTTDPAAPPDTLTLRLLVMNNPADTAVAQAVAAQWQALGVNVAPEVLPPVTYYNLLALREFDVALVTITPLHDPDLYDLWGQEAIIAGQNYASWNNRRASEALEAARQSWDMAERARLYALFQRHYQNDLPALSLYQSVRTYAVSAAVQELTLGRFDRPRDRYASFPTWTVLFREGVASCPAGEQP